MAKRPLRIGDHVRRASICSTHSPSAQCDLPLASCTHRQKFERRGVRKKSSHLLSDELRRTPTTLSRVVDTC